MSKKKNKNKQNKKTNEQVSNKIQQPATAKQETKTTNAQSTTYTDCIFYRKKCQWCALGVSPSMCNACRAYVSKTDNVPPIINNTDGKD